MSLEKSRHEALRWLQQAKYDLKAAESSLTAGSYEWACFQSQQAGEKALKAFWYSYGKDPWGHSLVRLIQDYPDKKEKSIILSLETHAKSLDKLYVPTRYPNGLPDFTPAEVFTEKDAREAITIAREVVQSISARIGD
ncbi:MAG: HEPN domain-containing protein [Armatimonadetes bacterium]|nr:HEPN domain-containing protein [Armatimonadota bacterium]